jgi:hypothetical protein
MVARTEAALGVRSIRTTSMRLRYGAAWRNRRPTVPSRLLPKASLSIKDRVKP